MSKLSANLLLLLTAFIWGLAFTAQSVGMKYVGPCTFVFTRFIIASLVLLPVTFVSDKFFNKKTGKSETKSFSYELMAGAICGFFLGIASLTQQIGITFTTVGKAGFITALYVVIVPILKLFTKKKPGIYIWPGAFFSTIGLYLVSVGTGFSVESGDMIVLLCALLFSFQIMSVDFFSKKINPIKLSNIGFFTASLVGLTGMLLYEKDGIMNITSALIPILYAGIFSSAGAYTMQAVAQRYTDPDVASLIMCLESVFSLLGGMLILKESMTLRESLGCLILFLSVVFVQIFELRAESK